MANPEKSASLPPLPPPQFRMADELALHRCVICTKAKPLAEFVPSQRNPGRPSATCKECSRKDAAERVVGGQKEVARNARKGDLGSVRAVTRDVGDAFKDATSLAAAQSAVNELLPDLLRYLWSEAKNGNQAAIKQLLEIASGKTVPGGGDVVGAGEPTLAELLADEPGASTDSA